MFHAHQSEFAELGWMGFFEVGRRRWSTSRPEKRTATRLVRPGAARADRRWCSRSRSGARRPRRPGLAQRSGRPIEELTVQRTELAARGRSRLSVLQRRAGPVDDRPGHRGRRLLDVHAAAGEPIWHGSSAAALTIPYPWVGERPTASPLLTATGSPSSTRSRWRRRRRSSSWPFFALFALIGVYVGVIPVSLGLLWFPFLRRLGRGGCGCCALTLGLLLFLAVDASARGGGDLAGGSQAFGGRSSSSRRRPRLSRPRRDRRLHEGRRERVGGRAPGASLALLIAVGIGLHNLGEGLAIGAASRPGPGARRVSSSSASRSTTRPRAWRSSRPLAGERPSLAGG